MDFIRHDYTYNHNYKCVQTHTTQIFDCPTGTNTHYAHMYVYILPSYTHTQLAAWAERSFVHSDSWHVVERIEER